MSVHEVARRLKVSKQAVAKLYHGGKVLAWQSQKKGALHFPSWQFAQGKRFDGLEEVLIKLNEAQILDDWGKIGFFLQNHGILAGRRPVDLLREHRLELVMKAVEAYV